MKVDEDVSSSGECTQPAAEDDKARKEFDRLMLEKLVQGQKAGGKFSRVKIDKRDEKESCVYRLGDFDPAQFATSKKRELSQVQMSARRKV